jgi:hypothetical protein
MAQKYGADAVRVGVHIENLANLTAMVRRSDLTPQERETAWENARMVCGAAVRELGEALNVSPEACFAVANSLQEYGMRAEEEMVGSPVPSTVADEAMAAIRQAQQGKAA